MLSPTPQHTLLSHFSVFTCLAYTRPYTHLDRRALHWINTGLAFLLSIFDFPFFFTFIVPSKFGQSIVHGVNLDTNGQSPTTSALSRAQQRLLGNKAIGSADIYPEIFPSFLPALRNVYIIDDALWKSHCPGRRRRNRRSVWV